MEKRNKKVKLGTLVFFIAVFGFMHGLYNHQILQAAYAVSTAILTLVIMAQTNRAKSLAEIEEAQEHLKKSIEEIMNRRESQNEDKQI